MEEKKVPTKPRNLSATRGGSLKVED